MSMGSVGKELLRLRHAAVRRISSHLVRTRGIEVGALSGSLVVMEDFLSAEEHSDIEQCAHLRDRLGRKRYGADHWDGVIASYKETELSDPRQWSPALTRVVQKTQAFIAGTSLDKQQPPLEFLAPHVIDISPKGFISAHVDSTKFSGGIVAGLSLLSTRVMRLRPDRDEVPPADSHSLSGEPDTEEIVEILLPPRSLYILTGTLRYRFSHEVLGSGSSKRSLLFSEAEVPPPERRLSIIFRDSLKRG